MKQDAWRQTLAAFEPAQPAATRFADVDTRRHINHIALYALQQEARLQWQLQHGCPPAEGALRVRPVAVLTEFWREAHYPQPLHSAVRLLAAGPDGLSLATGLFEGPSGGAQAIGAQQAWLAAWGRQGVTAQPLPSAMVAALAPAIQGGVDLPAPQRPLGSGDLHRYPVQQPYASRYGDLDADDCSSETAVMRGLEQARSALLKSAVALAGGEPERDWAQWVVARVALHFAAHRPPPAVWTMAGAFAHIGRTSAVLRVALFDGQALQAVGDCVLVHTGTGAGPQPVPDALRAALTTLAWRADAACLTP